jgi:predicted HTH domain antitoxin
MKASEEKVATMTLELLPGLSPAAARETFAAALLAEGKATITQGARLAGLSRRDFVAAMRRRKLYEALEDAADSEACRLMEIALAEGTIKMTPLREALAQIAAVKKGEPLPN